jgi:hypothetical protein
VIAWIFLVIAVVILCGLCIGVPLMVEHHDVKYGHKDDINPV